MLLSKIYNTNITLSITLTVHDKLAAGPLSSNNITYAHGN